MAAPIRATALTIDIDGVVNNPSNPIVEFLQAGTYQTELVDRSGVGGFKAWNIDKDVPASGCDGNGLCTGFGWLNTFRITSNEFGLTDVGDTLRWQTEDLAFDNRVVGGFTLAFDGNVNFFVSDNISGDNLGGLSVVVTLVPEPGSASLLAAGLIALALRRPRASSRRVRRERDR
ncbi:MAG: PEP-CTERM sorting domain-containing protein [Myxococcota bacterium]